MMVGVKPCGRCTIMALLPQIAKLPQKNHKNNDFHICLSKYITPLLNESSITSFQDYLSGDLIKKKPNPNLISKLLPLKTSIDIPIIISYTTKLHPFKFGL